MSHQDNITQEELEAFDRTARGGRLDMQSDAARLGIIRSLLDALPASPAAPSLVFRRPGGTVECVPIDERVTIGRGRDCEIRFEDRLGLSRRHFSVVAEAGRFFVEDHASSNGTTLAGLVGRIAREELHECDLIRAGGIIFLFVRPGPADG